MELRKNKVSEHLKKYRFFYVLALIFGVGLFLRAWNFSDWMHFELDQARDAKVIDLAVEHGIGNLPLLGPKAAGSFLRLGPVFYYFEYTGAKIFGSTPAGMASLNLIFSVLALPLLYLFARRYFSRNISALLFFTYSISLFFIMYSRFSWNPNSLPFFILLAFYSLLRSVEISEKKRGWWLVISVGALAVATQLHFVAFIVIPTVVVAFLLIKRPQIALKFWAAAIAILVFFYIPVIINDLKTGGGNVREFGAVFVEKSDSDDNTLIEKVVRDYTESADGYLLMVSGIQKTELPKLDLKDGAINIKCNERCHDNILWGVAALAFFTAGIVLLLRRMYVLLRKKESSEKDFIILASLWFGTSFIIFMPIAYDFAPRFFLVVSGLPFIFLGLIFEKMEKMLSGKRAFLAIFILAVVVLAGSNLMAVAKRFSELSRAPYENFETSDVILKERDRTTLEQQYMITDHIESIYASNGYPVYVNSESFYRRALLYHLERRGIPSDDFRNSQIAKKIYRNGNYFLVHPTNSNLESRTEKYLENYEIVEQKSFGTLLAIRLLPKEEAINDTEQEFGPEMKTRSAFGVPMRCRWNEVFGECNPEELEGEE